MPPLPSLLPGLPWQSLEVIVTVVAALGAILLTYGIFLKTEKRQDIVLFLGSFALIIYALYIGNLLFTIAMGGLMLATLVEVIEIAMGLHKDMGKK